MIDASAVARRRLASIAATLALAAAPLAAGQSAQASGAAAAHARAPEPVYFHTLPPGARLPTAAHCAKLVDDSKEPEDKAANKAYNRRTGQSVGQKFFSAGDNPLAQQRLAPLITGDFTGTTIDILRWTACKWGIDQDIVFAQAAVESFWQQDTLGAWVTDPADCAPGFGLGQDGHRGECPMTYGIMQDPYPYEDGGWPGQIRSTAMNADVAYATWRACFDGYLTWLNSVPEGSHYRAGDVWGCVGFWFAGRWRTRKALDYIAKVRKYLKEKIWLKPYFRQMG
jgi:hypothetical protein